VVAGVSKGFPSCSIYNSAPGSAGWSPPVSCFGMFAPLLATDHKMAASAAIMNNNLITRKVEDAVPCARAGGKMSTSSSSSATLVSTSTSDAFTKSSNSSCSSKSRSTATAASTVPLLEPLRRLPLLKRRLPRLERRPPLLERRGLINSCLRCSYRRSSSS